MNLWGQARKTLEMIKWEHSVFALPFALTGAMLAASGVPTKKLPPSCTDDGDWVMVGRAPLNK